MSLLLLEALGALLLLLLIVWWTMFSGRKNGELPQVPASTGADAADSSSSDEPKNRSWTCPSGSSWRVWQGATTLPERARAAQSGTQGCHELC